MSTQTQYPPPWGPSTTVLGKRKQADDGDDNDNDKNAPPAKKFREAPRPPVKKPCDFCLNHPAGQQAHRQRPCNWGQHRGHTVECQNCADYRSARPNDDPRHVCKISAKTKGMRIYGIHDPIQPQFTSCENCIKKGKQNTCDVDYALGYGCSTCRYSKKSEDKKCRANGRLMDTRPTVRLTFRPWFRHACDICAESEDKKPLIPCSWLGDRSIWDQRCNKCLAANEVCLDGGKIVEWQHHAPPLPTSWQVQPLSLRSHEARSTSDWRPACKQCLVTRWECMIDTAFPDNACIRCSELGIDCVTEHGLNSSHEKFRSLYDLSRVGFGNSLPFRPCTTCQAKGRNCDRQRPCDSCHYNGDVCDHFDTKKKAIFKNEGTYNCQPRFSGPPGPLYYLGLGYGALGVDDIKTGQNLEDWIGPLAPVYNLQTKGKTAIAGAATRLSADIIMHRNQDLPPYAPPNGLPHGALENLKPSQMSVGQLSRLISDHWPNAFPPAANAYHQHRLNSLDICRDRGSTVPRGASVASASVASAPVASAPVASAPVASVPVASASEAGSTLPTPMAPPPNPSLAPRPAPPRRQSTFFSIFQPKNTQAGTSTSNPVIPTPGPGGQSQPIATMPTYPIISDNTLQPSIQGGGIVHNVPHISGPYQMPQIGIPYPIPQPPPFPVPQPVNPNISPHYGLGQGEDAPHTGLPYPIPQQPPFSAPTTVDPNINPGYNLDHGDNMPQTESLDPYNWSLPPQDTEGPGVFDPTQDPTYQGQYVDPSPLSVTGDEQVINTVADSLDTSHYGTFVNPQPNPQPFQIDYSQVTGPLPNPDPAPAEESNIHLSQWLHDPDELPNVDVPQGMLGQGAVDEEVPSTPIGPPAPASQTPRTSPQNLDPNANPFGSPSPFGNAEDKLISSGSSPDAIQDTYSSPCEVVASLS